VGVLQGLTSYYDRLYAVWKGVTGDDRLWWSEFIDGRYWTEQREVGGNSSAGPAVAVFGGNMWIAWKGKGSDERLFSVQVDNGLWYGQEQIPGFGSTTGPSLAQYGPDLYAAWKGAETDQQIWYAHLDGQTKKWSQQATIPGVATSVGPSLCYYDGRLYAAWKGMNNDEAIWWAAYENGNWSHQHRIPNVASSTGPSLAVYNNRLYAAWKGVTGDERIWYSSFDGKSAWSMQQVIPNVGSSVGPALTEFRGKLHAMWKGASDDQQLWHSSFDGTNWAPQDRIPGKTGQDTPQNIGLRMQFQQTTLWCWIAVGVSVVHYYDGKSKATQCETMTRIGQSINNWPVTTQCCPTRIQLQINPDLAKQLVHPYDRNAQYALDGRGLEQVCIKVGGVDTVLKAYNNHAGDFANLSLEEIDREINAGRPVVASIDWTAGVGEGHAVAIVGVLNDLLLVSDPANGETVIRYQDFPTQYAGGASLNAYCKTKHA
jgi:hypothetical protein